MPDSYWSFARGMIRRVTPGLNSISLILGICSSWYLLSAFHQFFGQLGFSSPILLAVWVTTALYWVAGWSWTIHSDADCNQAPWKKLLGRPKMMLWALLVVTVYAPALWKWHDLTFQSSMLSSALALFAYGAIWSGVMLALPVLCCAFLSRFRSDYPIAESIQIDANFLVGMATGFLFAWSLPWQNLYVTGLLGALVCCVVNVLLQFKSLASYLNGPYESNTEKPVAGSTERLLPASHGSRKSDTPELTAPLIGWSSFVESSRQYLTLSFLGMTLVWFAFLFTLFFPSTVFTNCSLIAGLFLGLSWHLRSQKSARFKGHRFSLVVCGMLTLLILAATAGFSEVVFLLVRINSAIPQVWILQSIRTLIVMLVSVPVGYLAGRLLLPVLGSDSPSMPASRLREFGIVTVACGGIVAWQLVTSGGGIFWLGYVLAPVLLLSEVFAFESWNVGKRSPKLRAVICTVAISLLLGWVFGSGVRPELASRLLFSTRVMMASSKGVSRAELAAMDERRLIGSIQSLRGTLTAWKSAVSRLEIRENGIPRGVTSLNTGIVPQDSAEILLSTLPLVLHEDPQKVAVIGTGAGTPLQVCLSSPVLSVELIESSLKQIELLKQVTHQESKRSMWEDERLTVTITDPQLWAAARGESYDVVVANSDPSSLLHAAAQYSVDFYRRLNHRLNDHGIFCQRFSYHDYGPLPIRILAATAREAFAHVILVETGPGEMVLLATNSNAGLIRAGISTRAQAPHIQDLMAEVGWDWSLLLTLAAYDEQRFVKIDAGHNPGINTVFNAKFSAILPRELLRWAPKSLEVERSITKYASKFLNWIGEEAADDDLLRRLAEVKGQQELLTNYPDQYWAYRSQVKKQIATRPISPIQQVKFDRDDQGGLHPDDKRRLQYFKQLSKAIHHPNVEEVAKLASYAAPYDPLVSLFLHQELAEIVNRAKLSDSLELSHRLHALYFTSTNDRSVRNGLAAMRLVLEKADCLETPQERWDVLQALLQTLQYRWESRTTSEPGNVKFVIRDVDENIVLGERALETLAVLAPEVGVSDQECQARKAAVERNLLRPLRDYRLRLNPLLSRREYQNLEAEMNGDIPTDEDLQYPGANSVRQ